MDLSAGEPDGNPPAEASAAAIEAIRAGRNRYTPVAGTPELREAIADSYLARGLSCTPANVLVTMGGKQALYNLCSSLFGPGDEVIVFAPYWVSYLPQIELSQARPVIVATRPEDGFQPDMAVLRAAITPRTRGIIVNSPSNPTGCVIERSRLAEIAELAREADLAVISDEIYARLTYDGTQATCFPTLSQDAQERTVVVDAVSKTFAMTGWRVGWFLGPEEVVRACAKLQGHSTSGVCAVNQAAAAAALRAPADFHAPVLSALDGRRKLLVEGLQGIDGIAVGPVPQGAFYLFPRVDGLFGRTRPNGERIGSAMDVAEHLLEEGGVAVVPGEAFGEPRCVRISYALARQQVEEGLSRMGASLALLS